ncbi:MAG: hypothetical protein JNL79_37730 [Myxococcales bacterium]|nr:hypothetical protein [Myxococcales bacterium]
MRRPLLFALALLVASCGKPVRPMVLGQLDALRAEPAVAASKSGSPALYAHAESLRLAAERAFEAGDPATADLLGARAEAAYQRAAAMTRRTVAVLRKDKEGARLDEAKGRLEADDKARLDAEIEADKLAAAIAVRKEALAPVSSGPTTPAREAARWQVTRENVATADALCEGAALLAPKAKGLADAQKLLLEVKAKVEKGGKDSPLDASTRARALCLKALSVARDTLVKTGGTAGDALVADLEKAGVTAARDERGIVVTLAQSPKPASFEGQKLTAQGKGVLDTVGKLLAKHPAFAVVVVVHAAPGALDANRDKARGEAAKAELLAVGVDPARVSALAVGAAQGIVDDPKRKAENERVEIVLVVP